MGTSFKVAVRAGGPNQLIKGSIKHLPIKVSFANEVFQEGAIPPSTPPEGSDEILRYFSYHKSDRNRRIISTIIDRVDSEAHIQGNINLSPIDRSLTEARFKYADITFGT